MSYRGLARAADVSVGSIVHWETGATDPDRGTVEKLAKALGVSAAWLAYGQGQKETTMDRNTIELVSVGATDAERAVLAYYKGEPIRQSTQNGVLETMARAQGEDDAEFSRRADRRARVLEEEFGF